MRITRVETDLLKVPLPRPVTVSSGQDPRAAKDVDLLIVRLLTDGQHTGFGFTYGFDCGHVLKSTVDALLAPLVIGEDPARVEWLFLKAGQGLSTSGFIGLVARAYAAMDFALWDLKGQIAHLPVHQ